MKEIPEDVKQIDKRIKDFRSAEKNKNNKVSEKKFVYAYQTGTRIATELVSGVLVGAGVGYFLDELFETAPVLLIIFIIFGGAAGFLNVYRFVKREDQRKEEN